MKLFDDPKIGCYLDDIGHRVEKTKDGKEHKMVDLTLRVQPLTPELATSLDHDVRALLFTMNDASPKPKIKSVEFKLAIDRQQVSVFILPEGDLPAAITFTDVEISGVRARTEKGVDGYGLVFYASFGPVGKDELEYVVGWHTQQRFLSFGEQQPGLFADGGPEGAQAASDADGGDHLPEHDNQARVLPHRNRPSVPRKPPVDPVDQTLPASSSVS